MSNGLHQEKNFTVKWERDTKANIILFILVMHIREGMVVPNSAETRWNLVKRKKSRWTTENYLTGIGNKPSFWRQVSLSKVHGWKTNHIIAIVAMWHLYNQVRLPFHLSNAQGLVSVVCGSTLWSAYLISGWGSHAQFATSVKYPWKYKGVF